MSNTGTRVAVVVRDARPAIEAGEVDRGTGTVLMRFDFDRVYDLGDTLRLEDGVRVVVVGVSEVVRVRNGVTFTSQQLSVGAA